LVTLGEDLATKTGPKGRSAPCARSAGARRIQAGHLTKPGGCSALAPARRSTDFSKAHDVFEPCSLDDLARERQDLQRLGHLRRMRLIVADTGPLNYLVLIGESDISWRW
jgi:hypothetical protein